MKKTVFSDLGLSSNQLAQVVGFNIIRVMNAKKISLKELSQMTGIHYHQLSSYARGIHLPAASILYVLAKTLSFPMESFFEMRRTDDAASSTHQVADTEVLDYLDTETRAFENALEIVKGINAKFLSYKESMPIQDDPFLRHCILLLQQDAISLVSLLHRTSRTPVVNSLFDNTVNDGQQYCKNISFLLDTLKQNKYLTQDLYDEYVADIQSISDTLKSY